MKKAKYGYTPVKVRWNQQQYFYSQEKEALYHAFLLLSVKMYYEPTDVIRENICGMCDMFIGLLTQARKESKDKLKIKGWESLIRRLKTFKRAIMKTPRIDGAKSSVKIYDFLLRLDGMSTLHGFHFKRSADGTPEKQSVVQPIYKDTGMTNQLI